MSAMRSTILRSVLAATSVVGLLAGSAQAVPEAVHEAVPETAPGRDTIGAAGIGDRYYPMYGNGGYRVRHYGIRVAFNPRTERLRGVTVLRARALKRLTRFNLDLMLKASRVTVDGKRARFRQRTHELIVRPHRAIRKGERFRVRVVYAGVPKRIRHHGIRPWVTTPDGAVALGEPEIAAWWFPSNDHPADKARFDLRITVPRGRQAVSNGRLAGVRRTARTSTWHWVMPQPMATYLAFAAMGRYDIMRGRTKTGRPYLYAIGKGIPTRMKRQARSALRKTGRITWFLSKRFGPYPYGPVGGVVPNGSLGYALETQSRPVYDPSMFGYGALSLVVHEMAHQWFGDAVAVRRWRHIWLNEGFATYAEWLWSGRHGRRSANQRFHQLYRREGPDSPFWILPIGNPGRVALFDGAVYDRGAMAVHALRLRVGTKPFFTICRRWIQRNADGLGTTPELKRLAERISGRQLDGLFRAWLYGSDRPPLP
jgi:aminopeptidase N